MLRPLALVLLLGGCTAAPPPGAVCVPEPAAVIRTHGAGAEDLVVLPLGSGLVRLFVREDCPGLFGCAPGQARIGFVDLGAAAAGPLAPGQSGPESPEPGPSDPDAGRDTAQTALAWRPPGPAAFRPLGLSLVPGERPGEGVLFVIDAGAPVRLWRLPIRDGVIQPTARPWFEDRAGVLVGANDLQAVGETVYLTRYDSWGFLPWRSGDWPGVVAVGPSGTGAPEASVLPGAPGLRGANGILDLGPGRGLLVASYWERRLVLVDKADQGLVRSGDATAPLAVHPDNLTRDGGRVLIAGQSRVGLAALNLLLPFVPSPSLVLELRLDELGPEAEPRLLWAGGWAHGRSVSVAVPVAGGLALGQIRSPDILHVACPQEAAPG